MKKVGFIGAGNMAEAMIRGMVGAKLLPSRGIFVHDVRPKRMSELSRMYGVSVSASLADLVGKCGTIVFSVKPQVVPDVLRKMPKDGGMGKLFVSIAAGVKTGVFLSTLENARIVRAMPNTPAQAGMGSTGLYFADGVTAAQKEWARKIFSSFGIVAEFGREDLLDVVTALSGSGPAYAFLFIEALADGAVRSGMGREEALRLAAATVEGAARMVRESGKHPGELKDMVTSPGGTTAAGVAALERGAFRGTVMDAVFAAWQRCKELST
ncbi:MAG: pyrroline-5-carboxylate reductase [Deltaproteobacteria bacterium]|nr:pyrroline-5-carboxylate reductase [Deltaproteobacteria bacterium]